MVEYPDQITKLSVIGLGKLGAPMVACFSARGFQTIGVDLDAEKLKAINEGRAPVFEPQLQEMIDKGRERLSATLDIREAVLKSQVTFIIVATPSEPNGSFSLRFVTPVFEAIGAALREKTAPHIVSLTSTVMPGSMEQLRPLIERSSGKRAGVDFGLCYNPEFIALGSVVHDLLNPDFILIGESDPNTGDALEDIYKHFCANTPAFARMSLVNAELTKLSLNSFITTKISFANTLARICERLPQANVDVVTQAIGLDTRIGAKYLKGAIGYGGPCFPRDNKALARLAHNVGAPATIAEATDEFNCGEVQRLVDLIEAKLDSQGANVIAVLGLSYKPSTDVIEESQGVMLAEMLVVRGHTTIVYDPAAMENARQLLGDKVRYADSLEGCANAADVLVITTPWQAFKALKPDQITQGTKSKIIIDCWRMLDKQQFEEVAEYIPLGMGL